MVNAPVEITCFWKEYPPAFCVFISSQEVQLVDFLKQFLQQQLGIWMYLDNSRTSQKRPSATNIYPFLSRPGSLNPPTSTCSWLQDQPCGTCPKDADAMGAGEISSKISPTGLSL